MKTIYYAFVHELVVLDDATEEEIDNLVCEQLPAQVDFIWAEKPDLFDFY